MVDEVDRDLVAADELGDHALAAQQQRRGAGAVEQLGGGGGPGLAVVGGDIERRPAAPAQGVQGRQQARGRGTLRGADVGGGQIGAEPERGGEHAGVLAVGEGMGRGGEIDGAEVGRRRPREAVARRLDRKRQGILVPVADRPLALGIGLERGREPGIGVDRGLAAEAQARNVAAIGGDAEGHRPAAAASERSNTRRDTACCSSLSAAGSGAEGTLSIISRE